MSQVIRHSEDNIGESSLSPRELLHRQFLASSNLSENTKETSHKSISLTQVKKSSLTHYNSNSLKDKNKSVKFLLANSSSSTGGISAEGRGTSSSTASSISRLRRLSIRYDEEHPSEHPRSQIQRQFMEGIDRKVGDELEGNSTSNTDMETTSYMIDSIKDHQTEHIKSHSLKTLGTNHTDENSPPSSGMSTPTTNKTSGCNDRRGSEKMRADEVDQLLKVLEKRNLDPDPGPTEEYHPEDPPSAPDIIILENIEMNSTNQTTLQSSSLQFDETEVEGRDEIVQPSSGVVTSSSSLNAAPRLNYKPTICLFANATKLDFTNPTNLSSIREIGKYASTSTPAGISSYGWTGLSAVSQRSISQDETLRNRFHTSISNYCNFNSTVGSMTSTSRGSIEDRIAAVEANIHRKALPTRSNFNLENVSTTSYNQQGNVNKYQKGYLHELREINQKFAPYITSDSTSDLQSQSSTNFTSKTKKENILRRIYGTRDAVSQSVSFSINNKVTLADIRSLERDILTSGEYQPKPRGELPSSQSTGVDNISSIWDCAAGNRSSVNDEDVEYFKSRAGGRDVTSITPPPVPECGTNSTAGPQEEGNVAVRQLDWAAGPGGGDDDDEVPVTDSGLFDFDYTWSGILKKTKKILKKEYDWSSSSSENDKKKKKKSSKKDAKKRKLTRETSKKDMSKTMSDLWNREASNMEDIKNTNRAGIYGRLQRMKNYVDLTDDSIYFKEIVQDGMEMFKFFYNQVTEFVKGIKIVGKNPSLLQDAYDSVTTELLALINLAELGTYMDIKEEALLTALEDFEQALKDFDRLLRALVISISKKSDDTTCPFQLGDRVATLGYTGTVRYVGPTEIAEGVWVGIEGDQTIPSGNDGTHKFKRYFKCELGKGVFARPNMVAFYKVEKSTASFFTLSRAVLLIQRLVRNYRARKKAEKIKNTPKDLQDIDLHAINTPAEATESIQSLATYLTGRFSDEGHKARAVYRWITENISYAVADYLAMRYPDVTAEGTLANRTSVCAGYANLFKALCDAAGVKAVYISGYSKGHQFNKTLPLEQQMRHAWNAFKANGHWYLLEITWAAGHMDMERQLFVRQHSDFYWLTPPGEYIDGHYPEHPSWQLLAHPLTGDEFVNRVFPTTRFYELNVRLLDEAETIPDDAEGDAKVRLLPPRNVGLVTKLLRNDRQMASSYTFIGRKNKVATIFVKTYDPGQYVLKIYGKDMEDKKSKYDLIITYTIDSSKPSNIASFPFFWSEWGMPGHHLYSPIRGLLCIGKFYDFRLYVAEAKQVMMVMGKRQEKLELGDDGNWCKLNVQIEECNEVKIAAVYEKGAKGLLRFEVEDKKKIKLIKKTHKPGQHP
ncbi:hypothetical protein ACHWQZ_G015198 [Mnemiopsis leidyi]